MEEYLKKTRYKCSKILPKIVLNVKAVFVHLKTLANLKKKHEDVLKIFANSKISFVEKIFREVPEVLDHHHLMIVNEEILVRVILVVFQVRADVHLPPSALNIVPNIEMNVLVLVVPESQIVVLPKVVFLPVMRNLAVHANCAMI